MRYKISQAQAFGRSSGYFIHCFEFVPVAYLQNVRLFVYEEVFSQSQGGMTFQIIDEASLATPT